MKRLRLRGSYVLPFLIALGCISVLLIAIGRFTDIGQVQTDLEDLARAQSVAVETNKLDTDERLRFLQQYGVQGPEVSRTVVSSCYIDHDDTGFFAGNFNQKCYVQTTVGVRTETTPIIDEKTDMGSDWIPGFIECEVANQVSDLKGGNGASLVVTSPQLPNCPVPDPSTPGINVVAYAEDSVKSHTVSKTGEALIGSETVVWLIHSTDYWNEELGCRKPTFLLCDSPRNSPVLPKLPRV